MKHASIWNFRLLGMNTIIITININESTKRHSSMQRRLPKYT